VFRVPTYISRSSIHGIGVFTPVFIPAGTVIWTLDTEVDWLLSAADLEGFPEPYQERLRGYCYLDESGFYVLCGDNARFMNHTEEPNCDDRGGASTIASRDIQPHEELTCDYRAFDVESRGESAEPFVRSA